MQDLSQHEALAGGISNASIFSEVETKNDNACKSKKSYKKIAKNHKKNLLKIKWTDDENEISAIREENDRAIKNMELREKLFLKTLNKSNFEKIENKATFFRQSSAHVTSGIDKQDERGETRLHLAAAWDDVRTVKYLVRNGANPDILNNTNQTPLDYARARGEEDIIKLLTEVTSPDLCEVYISQEKLINRQKRAQINM